MFRQNKRVGWAGFFAFAALFLSGSFREKRRKMSYMCIHFLTCLSLEFWFRGGDEKEWEEGEEGGIEVMIDQSWGSLFVVDKLVFNRGLDFSLRGNTKKLCDSV